MKNFTRQILLVCAAVSMTGCLEKFPEFGIPAGEQPWAELNPMQEVFYAMHDSPAHSDQHDGQKYPPPSTEPQGFARYPLTPAQSLESAAIRNPIAPTAENLKYGKQMFETTCAVCHGVAGTGQGYVVPPYPLPPDLTAGRARNWSDGEIYHVITNGQGRMWSYKSQLTEMERWAVVNYVRVLQRAKNPEPTDLGSADEAE